MSNKKKNNKPKLNDYHQKRNKEGLEEVRQMLKHPASFEEMKAQIQRNMNQ